MPKIIVFTQDLDFYSEQLLNGLTKNGYEVLCVVDPRQRESFPKWESKLNIIELVELCGRLDIKAAKKYSELIKHHRPDICLCYTSRALSVALKAKRYAKLTVPVVGTRGAVGGISCWNLQDWFSYLNPSLDAVICMSNAIRNRLEQQARYLWRAHPGKFVTIYQGYSSLLASATTRNHRDRSVTSPRVMMSVTNERPIKGMMHLLDALEYHVVCQNWELIWVGEVSEATKKRITSSSKLKQRVVCLGYRADARALLAQADLYLQPTIAPGEGIGNAIAEAMAAELTVVTSNVGGAPELVGLVSAELLFESANARAIAKVLDKLLVNTTQCEQFGRTGAQVLRTQFNLDNEIAQHIALFQELASKKY